MAELVHRLRDRARKEIRYARGMQCMHRERYLEYVRDMQTARNSGDEKRRGEIADDLRAFIGEMWHLMEAQRSAYERLHDLTILRSDPPTIIGDTTTPEGDVPPNVVRLVLTRRTVE
jgi:hypothetical protein